MTETARHALPPAPVGDTHPYILFSVAGTTYGLRSHDVEHVEMIDQVTSVPNAPPCVEGVVFSRGHVVPVVNLRVRFGFDRRARDLRTRLLIVRHEGRRVGLMADEAREFIAIPDAAIRPPHEAVGGLSGNYLTGVATFNDRIVLILDTRDVIVSAALVAAP
jgi:chemotaxis signal transduction protein